MWLNAAIEGVARSVVLLVSGNRVSRPGNPPPSPSTPRRTAIRTLLAQDLESRHRKPFRSTVRGVSRSHNSRDGPLHIPQNRLKNHLADPIPRCILA